MANLCGRASDRDSCCIGGPNESEASGSWCKRGGRTDLTAVQNDHRSLGRLGGGVRVDSCKVQSAGVYRGTCAEGQKYLHTSCSSQGVPISGSRPYTFE